MDWRWLLFSFHGRINRAKYWLSVLIYLIAGVLLVVIAAVLHFAIGVNAILQILAGIVDIVFVVSSLAVATKRLHDRDRSAWWLLMFYVASPVGRWDRRWLRLRLWCADAGSLNKHGIGSSDHHLGDRDGDRNLGLR